MQIVSQKTPNGNIRLMREGDVDITLAEYMEYHYNVDCNILGKILNSRLDIHVSEELGMVQIVKSGFLITGSPEERSNLIIKYLNTLAIRIRDFQRYNYGS